MNQLTRSYARPDSPLPLFLAFGLLLLFAAAPALAAVDRKEYPAPPGLEEVKNREFDILYVKPGFQPGDYGKLVIEEPQVAVSDYWEWSNRQDVSQRDLERIYENTAEILRDKFADKLTAKDGFELVENAAAGGGKGVLRLKPSVFDLHLYGADLSRAPNKDTYVKSAGNATLHLDLYDADSGELLLRVIDHDSARHHQRFYEANRATNYHDMRIMISRWATALRKQLDALSGGTA